jgi:hypothetical protein
MAPIVNISLSGGRHTGAKASGGKGSRLALSVHSGQSQALPERLWGRPWGPFLTSGEKSHIARKDKVREN